LNSPRIKIGKKRFGKKKDEEPKKNIALNLCAVRVDVKFLSVYQHYKFLKNCLGDFFQRKQENILKNSN
jgi:hypothetical protein